MASSLDPLTPLQRELIALFFKTDDRFWLTGGAALAGFHLRHRATHDLDLFGPPEADLEDAVRRAEAAAHEAGATATRLRTSPTFVRLLVSRGDDTCEIDLVRDHTPRVAALEVRGNVRVDSMREIAANKIAALVSRSEVRDLVDLRHLVRAGVDLDTAFEDATKKDAGLSPDTLAMSLSWLPISEATALLANERVEDLREFRDELVRRFRARAFPGLE